MDGSKQYKLQKNLNITYTIPIQLFIYVCVKKESYVSSYSGYYFRSWKSQDKKSVIVIPFLDDTFFSRILPAFSWQRKIQKNVTNAMLLKF